MSSPPAYLIQAAPEVFVGEAVQVGVVVVALMLPVIEDWAEERDVGPRAGSFGGSRASERRLGAVHPAPPRAVRGKRPSMMRAPNRVRSSSRNGPSVRRLECMYVQCTR